jgi:hypothetical protein
MLALDKVTREQSFLAMNLHLEINSEIPLPRRMVLLRLSMG